MCISVVWIICVIVHMSECASISVCTRKCVCDHVCVWYIAHPQMYRAGGHITLLWAKLQAGAAVHSGSHTYSHVSPLIWWQKKCRIKKAASVHLIMFHSIRARMSPSSHACEWLSTCVFIMMPHLSSPTASCQLPEDESEWNPRLVGLHSQLGLFI